MTFLSLLAALALEQAWPLRQGNPFREAYRRCAQWLQGQLDGGELRHGTIAWLAAVVPVAALTVALEHALGALGLLAFLLWNVAVLYLTMGFRQFSHAFTEIQKALRAGDLQGARDRIGNWRGEPSSQLGAGEVARLAIEHGLVASHRHVFGTLFWFVALGAAGAVMYRASAMLTDAWPAPAAPEPGGFGRFSKRAFYWLDWLPARVTAACFAIVGDFEDAAYCWRTQARAWAAQPDGILLAAGGGALGVRLGDALPRADGTLEFRPEMGLGEEADADAMESATGLTWRALVLAMFLILLVSLAHALG